ncbi:hypothetical protein COU20_01280 [Candidatus Kaiserbacteria bacterium CG10_big_fil_rev_8_21_14_0_10_59_10]|uniref:tetrahydrofolate synthase n=1 Tax=Candidatus Kaiserbacteria bacterium CG10_big_fil_rev_8_21_14_0_10_59_10 TaxID=1974612 RepID=A0A2H0U8C7_9BACT|nr:MAG: hypothetical protein COU20_01280 [Candidatus Kaiserbacteria bacterium CG10_big_fil_rev_8_21_14_0_10_59_10]
MRPAARHAVVGAGAAMYDVRSMAREKQAAAHDIARYRRAVRFLEGLSNLPQEQNYMRGKARDPSIFLKRTRFFLDALGAPDRGLKYVHITGTAGKGTVAAMVAGALAADGRRVGLFTSPFVTTSAEKIQVNGRFIPAGEFADMVEEMQPMLDTLQKEGPYGRPSYFELFLALALLYFKRKKCEWAVLEVGAGGRYDATNVVEKPVATAITNIDYDHVRLLGNTLQKIASDKAGIIKRGSHFFTAEGRPSIASFFEKECRRVGASFTRISPQASHNQTNIELAGAIARVAGVREGAVARAVRNAKLPCRFEIVQKRPLVILDGAHNRIKMRAVRNDMEQVEYHRLHLVLGMARKREREAMLEEIVPRADFFYATRFQTLGQEAADPAYLLAKARQSMKKGANGGVYLDPGRALEAALKRARADDAVLVTGSFYLAGELRERWYPEERALKRRSNF